MVVVNNDLVNVIVIKMFLRLDKFCVNVIFNFNFLL